MTKLQPITSEEVLAHQVEEHNRSAPQPVAKLAEKAASNNDVTSVVAGQPSSKTIATDTVKPERINAEQTGYNYRLPLGSYILFFVYVELCALILVSTLLSVISYTHYAQHGSATLDEAWGTISRETWIALVVTATVATFIISGNKTLRWCVIIGASIVGLILACQAAVTIGASAGYPGAMNGIAILVAGIALCITTVVYLLRKKVAAAYE